MKGRLGFTPEVHVVRVQRKGYLTGLRRLQRRGRSAPGLGAYIPHSVEWGNIKGARNGLCLGSNNYLSFLGTDSEKYYWGD